MRGLGLRVMQGVHVPSSSNYTINRSGYRIPGLRHIKGVDFMHRSVTRLIFLPALLSACLTVFGQSPSQLSAQVQEIQNNSEVKAANEFIDRNRAGILREWIQITEINAPSGHEQERAKYLERLLRQSKLQNIHYDSAGNLIAVRKGTGGGRTVVFDAHFDTVFKPG